MTPRPPGVSGTRFALDAIAETARALAGASVDEVLRMSPSLALRAVPEASSALLSMRCPDELQPMWSRAERGGHAPRPPSPGSPCPVLSLRVATHDRWAWGYLVLTTELDEGLIGVAALTAELVAVHIEQAMDLAHLREVDDGMRVALAHARDIGMAIGISLASTDAAGEAAHRLGQSLDRQTQRELTAVAGASQHEHTAVAPVRRLRLVRGSDDPG